MEIFWLRKEDFSKYLDEKSLKYFLEGKIFKSEKRTQEYALSRFLVHFVLKKMYKIQDYKIGLKKDKPRLLGKLEERLFFSISHSKNIVAAAFDSKGTGFDIEYMKKRDTKRLSEYLDFEYKNLEDFYRKWTQHEADFKLQTKAASRLNFKLENYMAAVSSAGLSDIKRRLKIYELKTPTASTKPRDEISLKLVIESIAKENTVVAQEMSTASLVFLMPDALNIE